VRRPPPGGGCVVVAGRSGGSFPARGGPMLRARRWGTHGRAAGVREIEKILPRHL
jgi:hypothetical protein